MKVSEDLVDFEVFKAASVIWEGTKTGVDAERGDASQTLLAKGFELANRVDRLLVSEVFTCSSSCRAFRCVSAVAFESFGQLVHVKSIS